MKLMRNVVKNIRHASSNVELNNVENSPIRLKELLIPGARDLLYALLEWLLVNDLGRMRRVNKYLKAFIDSERMSKIWKEKYRLYFGWPEIYDAEMSVITPNEFGKAYKLAYMKLKGGEDKERNALQSSLVHLFVLMCENQFIEVQRSLDSFEKKFATKLKLPACVEYKPFNYFDLPYMFLLFGLLAEYKNAITIQAAVNNISKDFPTRQDKSVRILKTAIDLNCWFLIDMVLMRYKTELIGSVGRGENATYSLVVNQMINCTGSLHLLSARLILRYFFSQCDNLQENVKFLEMYNAISEMKRSGATDKEIVESFPFMIWLVGWQNPDNNILFAFSKIGNVEGIIYAIKELKIPFNLTYDDNETFMHCAAREGYYLSYDVLKEVLSLEQYEHIENILNHGRQTIYHLAAQEYAEKVHNCRLSTEERIRYNQFFTHYETTSLAKIENNNGKIPRWYIHPNHLLDHNLFNTTPFESISYRLENSKKVIPTVVEKEYPNESIYTYYNIRTNCIAVFPCLITIVPAFIMVAYRNEMSVVENFFMLSAPVMWCLLVSIVARITPRRMLTKLLEVLGDLFERISSLMSRHRDYVPISERPDQNIELIDLQVEDGKEENKKANEKEEKLDQLLIEQEVLNQEVLNKDSKNQESFTFVRTQLSDVDLSEEKEERVIKIVKDKNKDKSDIEDNSTNNSYSFNLLSALSDGADEKQNKHKNIPVTFGDRLGDGNEEEYIQRLIQQSEQQLNSYFN